MDKNAYEIIRLRMERTAESLRKNGFFAVCCENREEALEIVESLLPEDAVVAVGGSVTLNEVGAIELLRSGRYRFHDRYTSGLTREQVEEIFRKSFYCDVYLTGTNAVTEDGKLYNIDGNGNRVAAMIYGPRSVIVIAGYNKIASDVEAARERIKGLAAPANAVRLNCNTPCTKTGMCGDCHSNERICAAETILTYCRQKERIKVILVGEELGY